MEEKKNSNKQIIINGILSALIPSLIILALNASMSFFMKEKINISISDSTYDDGVYITSLNIKNYQKDKSIDKINFWITNTEIRDIKSDIKNLYDKDTGNIKFSSVIPNYKGTILIYSTDKINNENLKVETEEKSDIVFLNEQRERAFIDIKEYAIIAIIYFVVLSAVTIISSMNIRNRLDEKIKEVRRENDKIEKRLDKTEEEGKELENQLRRIKIRFVKTISDYAKELEFWKDTIRKILYESNKNKIESEDIFKMVTLNLKTYNTLRKCDYRDINVLLDEKEEND